MSTQVERRRHYALWSGREAWLTIPRSRGMADDAKNVEIPLADGAGHSFHQLSGR
jgi:hypothetical protein